jgi:hypothetical protein
VQIPTRRAAVKIYVTGGELWIGDAKWDGRHWEEKAAPAAKFAGEIERVVPGAPGEYWLVSRNNLTHLAGAAATDVRLSRSYEVMCAGERGKVWLLGSHGLLRGEDGHWQAFPAMSSLEDPILSDCATFDGAVWVVGRGGRVLRSSASPS